MQRQLRTGDGVCGRADLQSCLLVNRDISNICFMELIIVLSSDVASRSRCFMDLCIIKSMR